MQNTKNTSLAIAILGLLLTCCLCPVVVNSVVFLFSNGRTSLYGKTFSSRIGSLNLATYLSTTQLTCSIILALAVLVIGIVMFIQARNGKPKAE